MSQEYLIIENNVVTNNVVWNGNTNLWNPPVNSTTLVKASVPALVWKLDSTIVPKKYVLIEVFGAGDIGFTWDGTKLTTNQPKPEIPV